MAGMKKLGDAGRRAAKEQFKRYLNRNMSDPRAIIFMLDQFDLAYDLIIASIEKGGMPTKGDVIRYLGGKANSFAGFSNDNRVACVSSVVSLGLTASSPPAAVVAGPLVAWTWYIGAVLLDMLDVGGNCYLLYLDTEIERKTEEFRKQINARRAWGHAQAVCSVQNGQELAIGLEAILNYQQSQPPAMPRLQ